MPLFDIAENDLALTFVHFSAMLAKHREPATKMLKNNLRLMIDFYTLTMF